MNPIVAFIKLIRLPNLLIIVATQYAIRFGIMYPILSSISDDVDVSLQMAEFDFFLLSLSTVMIAAAGYIINDYFDVKVDRVNRPDRIIVGKYIKRRIAMGSHVIINSIAIIIGGYVAYAVGNWKLVFIQLLAAGALWNYSILFKKQVLVGNVIVALLAALVPFVAGIYELTLLHTNMDVIANNLLFYLDVETPFEEVAYLLSVIFRNIMYWVLGFTLFAFISTMVREIIKDIEDYEGDKKYYHNTLAVTYGKQKTKLVAQGIAVVMIGLIAYLQFIQLQSNDMASFMYFLFTIQVPLIYLIYKLKLANQKADYTSLSRVTKLIMLMGIAYTAFFYYSTIYL